MNLKDYKDKTILILGKTRAFSADEFNSLMGFHKIGFEKEVQEGITLIVEGAMMNPYEQNASEELYEKGLYTFVSIDELEKALAQELDSDTLLMSLKLSHDKERLKAFILNSMISDSLFFKLLDMYKWQNEDFFENDDNRDVSAAFISRFYENIERNHNVQYATTGFIHLVSQASSPDLLSSIAKLQPLKYHPKIEMAIAMNRYCDETLQEKYFKRSEARLNEALSFNVNLKETLIVEFLEDEELSVNVAKSIKLTEKLFSLFLKNITSLALNESLSLKMQTQLVESKNSEVLLSLAQNENLEKEIVDKLMLLKEESITMALMRNKSTPSEILNAAYKDEKYHMALAKNENTPVEILYQLQLDSRYERSVKTNAGFGKHIQSENIGWLV